MAKPHTPRCVTKAGSISSPPLPLGCRRTPLRRPSPDLADTHHVPKSEPPEPAGSVPGSWAQHPPVIDSIDWLASTLHPAPAPGAWASFMLRVEDQHPILPISGRQQARGEVDVCRPSPSETLDPRRFSCLGDAERCFLPLFRGVMSPGGSANRPEILRDTPPPLSHPQEPASSRSPRWECPSSWRLGGSVASLKPKIAPPHNLDDLRPSLMSYPCLLDDLAVFCRRSLLRRSGLLPA